MATFNIYNQTNRSMDSYIKFNTAASALEFLDDKKAELQSMGWEMFGTDYRNFRLHRIGFHMTKDGQTIDVFVKYC